MFSRLTLVLLTGFAVTAVAADHFDDTPSAAPGPSASALHSQDAAVLTVTAPPAGSPMALGHHPRIFFTAADIPTIRGRIRDHYRAEFQAFLDMLGSPGLDDRKLREIEANWGSLNYAFVAALDPAALQGMGFRLPGAYQTRAQLCGRAVSYAKEMLPTIARGRWVDHSYLTTGYPEPVHVPVAAAYDWCHAEVSDADKRQIVEAFVEGFRRRYGGKDPSTMEIKGLDRLANNQASAGMQDLLSILAFWGDRYAPADVQQEMYRYFATTWTGRLLAELEVLYGEGAGWHEGPGGYFTEGFVNIAWGLTALSPAVGRPYPAELPFFTRQGEHLQGLVKPMTIAENCGRNGAERCPTRYERWGSMSGGIGAPSCRQVVPAAGILRAYDVPSAGLLKWGIDYTVGGCDDLGRRFGGPWANAVYYWFLFGDRGVRPQSPAESRLPLTLRHGLGVYSMKTDYTDPTATHVVFFAQPVVTYGHGTRNYGDFSLSKYGNLIVQAGNRKSGEGAIDQGETPTASILRNVVTVHKGDDDVNLGTDSAGPPADALRAYGIGEFGRAGRVLGEALNDGTFDYVSYDNSDVFSSGVATLSQREFVYLRGPEDSEYLVLLDRFNAVNPVANDKIWRVWVPTQPYFVNGVGTQPRAGKWTSTTSDLIVLTNHFGRLKTDVFETGGTNGRFFMKTLLPERPVINFIGGEGMEFQSGNDDGATTWGAPKMTQAMREYLGWGRIEVRPAMPREYDLFLNVIQFGGADSLSRPSEMHRLTSPSSRMTGVHIRDPRNEWVLMFASDDWPGTPRNRIDYAFRPGAADSDHLLVNMAPSTRFSVRTDATAAGTRVVVAPDEGGTTVESSRAGVIRFTLNGQRVETAPVQLPGSPSNLRRVGP